MERRDKNLPIHCDTEISSRASETISRLDGKEDQLEWGASHEERIEPDNRSVEGSQSSSAYGIGKWLELRVPALLDVTNGE